MLLEFEVITNFTVVSMVLVAYTSRKETVYESELTHSSTVSSPHILLHVLNFGHPVT